MTAPTPPVRHPPSSRPCSVSYRDVREVSKAESEDGGRPRRPSRRPASRHQSASFPSLARSSEERLGPLVHKLRGSRGIGTWRAVLRGSAEGCVGREEAKKRDRSAPSAQPARGCARCERCGLAGLRNRDRAPHAVSRYPTPACPPRRKPGGSARSLHLTVKWINGPISDSPDPPARYRIIHGTRRASPDVPSPRAPPQTHGTLPKQLAWPSATEPQVRAAAHCTGSPSLRSCAPAARDPHARGAGTSDRRDCHPHQELIGGASGGGNRVRGHGSSS